MSATVKQALDKERVLLLEPKETIKKETITPDKAFRIMNMFMNHQCLEYARRVKDALPEIRQIANYYRRILPSAKLGDSERGLVQTFLAQYRQTENLLAPWLEMIEEAERAGFMVC